MSIEAMKQALEALEHESSIGNDNAYQLERDALRTAIAEAEKQEPGVRPCHVFNVKKTGPLTEWEPTSMALALPDGNHALYTTPPAAQRQHITDGSPCWCEPETSYTDPETGASVIVHREPQ